MLNNPICERGGLMGNGRDHPLFYPDENSWQWLLRKITALQSGVFLPSASQSFNFPMPWEAEDGGDLKKEEKIPSFLIEWKNYWGHSP